jgi:hypothetical protein
VANKTFHLTECAEPIVLPEYPVLQRSRPTLFELTFVEIYGTITREDVASITLRNIALDKSYGPHVPAPNCTNCAGLVTIEGNSVQTGLQGILLTHFAAASADLTSYGGSPARSITTSLPLGTGCIEYNFAFQADWNTTSSRYGVFFQWVCDAQHSYPLPIEVYGTDGGIRGHVWLDSLQEGFNTVVFTGPK